VLRAAQAFAQEAFGLGRPEVWVRTGGSVSPVTNSPSRGLLARLFSEHEPARAGDRTWEWFGVRELAGEPGVAVPLRVAGVETAFLVFNTSGDRLRGRHPQLPGLLTATWADLCQRSQISACLSFERTVPPSAAARVDYWRALVQWPENVLSGIE